MFIVPGDLDFQSGPSEGPNTSSVCMAQIRSGVPEIFHTQTKNRLMAPESEPSAVHCMR